MSETDNDQTIRLNKFIATHSGISRREADDLIATQQVSLNGQIAQLGSRYNLGDQVHIKDEPLQILQETTTILFHKPAGYVCSRRQQGDSPTIYSLLPADLQRLKTVGRLDRDSSGLLLLTDDGDLTHRLTHPKFHKQKTYEVRLDSNLQPLHHQMINDYGVMLEDGKSQLSLVRPEEGNHQFWQVLMHEGRNRQIRRTFAALGYGIKSLHRTSFGSYQLGSLASGKYTNIN